jgi:lipopolysaccharide export system protein LptA
MVIKRFLTGWILIGVIFISWCNLFAKEPGDKKKIDGNQSIQIVSDRLDAYSEKKMVVFSGNAVATQSGRVIKSDQLVVHYREEPGKKSKDAPKTRDDMGALEKIEAKGHVTVTQGERIVTGDYAVFLHDSQKIVMTGNAVMREGRNVVRGEKITVFLDEDRGIVESSENKRVKAIIYPDDDKERKSDQR